MDDPTERAEVYARHVATRQPSALLQRLEAGDPVVIPGPRIGGGRELHQQCPWLSGSVRLFSDDSIEPA